MIYQLKSIVNDIDYSSEIDKIDTITVKTMKIKNFHGASSAELKYDKDFEMNCILLSSHTNKPVKELTVKEYFALIKHVNDENKKRRK